MMRQATVAGGQALALSRLGEGGGRAFLGGQGAAPGALSPRPKRLSARDFGLGALVGIAFFLLVYGPSTLDVTYDSWIYAGYAEWDIVQRYAGWMFYRHADWSWPLTVAGNLAQPLGVSTAFTDSIPLLTLLLKPFSALLPATFQYFGWYNLLNCALQGGFAVLLLRCFPVSRVYATLGSVLFVSYPIMVERLFRHDGLASQWLVLAAFLLYIRAGRGQFSLPGFVALCVLAAGISFYFVPMVLAVLLAALLNRIRRQGVWLRPVLCLGVCIAATLGSMYLLGILTRGGGGEAEGFGEFSMNLNALVNPSSLDDYADGKVMAWSRVLPVLAQRHRQYDGFNYMGLGVLAGLAAMLLWYAAALVRCVVKRDGGPLRRALQLAGRHLFLLLVVLCMAVFAPSNVVTLGGRVLFTIPLPGFVLRFCEIFRSSGRFFWPLSYLLLLGMVLFIHARLRGRWRLAGLAVLAAVQLFDLSGTLAQKQAYFAQPVVANNEFESEDWIYFAENYDNVVCLGPIFDYDMAAGIIRYNPNAQTNILLANRGNFNAVLESYDVILESLRSGGPLPENTIWLCTDDGTLEYALEGIHPTARAYRTGRYRIIAVPYADCPVEEYLPGQEFTAPEAPAAGGGA